MATLKLIDSMTNELFDVCDLDFAEVTPNDILSCEELKVTGKCYLSGKDSTSLLVDRDRTLEELGFKDGDTVYFLRGHLSSS